MSETVPTSAEGKPFQYKFSAFKSDFLDFTANHPGASEAEKELGAIGLVVLPELTRLFVEIRAIYSGVQVQHKPCHMLCLAGLALIFEHIVLLLSEALLDREIQRRDTLESLIDELCDASFLDETERNELHSLRKLRNQAVHRQFKHTGIDVKAKFLEMYSALMTFLRRRFITGGGVPPAPKFLELQKGAYYIRPSFESDKFVQKFWLPRCVPAGEKLG